MDTVGDVSKGYHVDKMFSLFIADSLQGVGALSF